MKSCKFFFRVTTDTVIKDCACKLVTVDAYSQSLGFYEKTGFEYLTPNDRGKDTRQMFLDITQYIA